MKTGKQTYSKLFLMELARKCVKDGDPPQIYRKLYFNDSELSKDYIEFLEIYKMLYNFKESYLTLSYSVQNLAALTAQKRDEYLQHMQRDIKAFGFYFKKWKQAEIKYKGAGKAFDKIDVTDDKNFIAYVKAKNNWLLLERRLQDTGKAYLDFVMMAVPSGRIEDTEYRNLYIKYKAAVEELQAVDDYCKLLILGIF